MSLFRRAKPLPPASDLPTITSPALDEARERLAELTRETEQRIDRLLAKLRARLQGDQA